MFTKYSKTQGAPKIGKTLFFKLKPWYVREAKIESCVCHYHLGFRKEMKNLAMVWDTVHKNCSCNCNYCNDGGSKHPSNPFFSGSKLIVSLLCPTPMIDGCPAYPYKSCIAGDCENCN